MTAKSPAILLVYDEECPLCHAYCRMVRLRQTAGALTLVNARGQSTVADEITARGLDIDQGMVLKIDDALYYGSDAIHALSLMSSNSGLFNRFNFWIFRSSRRAHFLYPVLRTCRNLLLKILGRSKINNLGLADNQWF